MKKKNNIQLSLFENDDKQITKIAEGKTYSTEQIEIPLAVSEKLKSYNLKLYVRDVEKEGLELTWNYICQFVIENNQSLPEFLNIKNFGELYEIGLATQDKLSKKKSGQYYTPDDVALVMSQWLEKCDGDSVCDVACGTGKLILTYLDLIGYEKARELISSGKLYLYDFDNVALKICRTTIAVKYGLDIANKIHDIFCDFLDNEVILPDNCKVISNPPYAQIEKIQKYWEHSDVLMDTKEFYSSFMEKIFREAKSTVIITPFSFISGNKFYSLRKEMCDLGNGFIVSFDNVPGNIFCGRKHGIFNTNTANSVRAAITVLKKDNSLKGFRISPLIRFKNEERTRLLTSELLEKTLPCELQVVSNAKKQFRKIQKNLVELFDNWVQKSKFTVKDVVSKQETKYLIDIPNTCRYYTTASGKKLSRTGSITMYVRNEREFNFLYCIINSSFTYWWWRVFDGGITYPVSLLNAMPLPLNLLSADDEDFFEKTATKLLNEESEFIIKKVNAGVPQENIKFPEEYREAINLRLLRILGSDLGKKAFKRVHSNCYFEDNDNEDTVE